MNVQTQEEKDARVWPWLSSNFAWLLLSLAFFGIAVGETYRYLLFIAALVGLFWFVRRPRPYLTAPAVRLLLMLFLCLWIPMLASMVDTQYLGRATSVAARYIMYLLAGIAIVRLAQQAEFENRLLAGFMAVMLFWTFDAVLQAITGHNLLGYETSGERLTGMFGSRPRVGIVLTLFSPIYFEAVRRLSVRFPWAWLLLLPFVAVVVLSGSRSAWMLFTFSTIAYLVYLYVTKALPPWRRWLMPVLAVVVLSGALVWQLDWLRYRIVAATGIFSMDYQTADIATSKRLPAWETAWNMFKDNPVNGVGPRSFGSAFRKYAPTENTELFNQPHLLLAEIAAETGIIGLMGYVAFLAILIRHMWSIRMTRPTAIPWGIATLLVGFPLSAFLAFYAHFMSALLWMCLIAYAALAFREPVPPQ